MKANDEVYGFAKTRPSQAFLVCAGKPVLARGTYFKAIYTICMYRLDVDVAFRERQPQARAERDAIPTLVVPGRRLARA